MYKKSIFSWLKHWDFMLLDFLVMQLSLLIAYGVFKHALVYSSDVYRIVALSLLVAQFLVVFFLQTFKNVLKRGYYLEFVSCVKHTLGVVLVDLSLLFFLHYSGLFSRKIYTLTIAIYFLLAYLSRIGLKLFLYKTNRVTEGNRSVFIISTSEMADSIVDNFMLPQFRNFKIVGVHIMDEVDPFVNYGDIPVLGAGDDVLGLVDRLRREEVRRRAEDAVGNGPEGIAVRVLDGERKRIGRRERVKRKSARGVRAIVAGGRRERAEHILVDRASGHLAEALREF